MSFTGTSWYCFSACSLHFFEASIATSAACRFSPVLTQWVSSCRRSLVCLALVCYLFLFSVEAPSRFHRPARACWGSRRACQCCTCASERTQHAQHILDIHTCACELNSSTSSACAYITHPHTHAHANTHTQKHTHTHHTHTHTHTHAHTHTHTQAHTHAHANMHTAGSNNNS